MSSFFPVVHTAKPISTLCDFCSNACGHCPWSQKFVQLPVPGWDAVRHDICLDDDPYSPLTESYIVIHCPLFHLESHRASEFQKVDWNRVRSRAQRTAKEVNS